MAQEKGNLSINSENFLPIIKKWLYTDKDIFIRELVSNGCDAVTKLQKLISLGEAKNIPDDEKYEIHVVQDRKNQTLSISDNGIGMTDEEIKKYINQIAFSGATDFLAKYEEKPEENNDIIGHFGLGFYSAFMVADKVEIDSLSYQEGAAPAKWICEGGIDYEMEVGARTERGTTVTLHIGESGKEFLDESALYSALRKYCSFMPVEIYVDVIEEEEEKKDETPADTEANAEEADNVVHISADELEEKTPETPAPLNDTNPLWLRQPKDCTDEEYKEFYHKVFMDHGDPLFWIHLNMDYPFRLKGILYFPKLLTEMDAMDGEIKLYSNQVYIADNIKEVVPEFLLLLKGVMDCPDLPLNVSRSALQNDGYAGKMSSYITKKVADKLNQLFKNERQEYEKFFDDISVFIKYGCMKEDKLYDKIKDSVLYKTTDGLHRTMAEYLEKNKERHENKIFYVTDEIQQSQYINMFKEQGMEALILSAPIDKPYISFLEYRERDQKIRFARIDADISDSLLSEDAESKEEEEKRNEELQNLFRGVLNDDKLLVKAEGLKSPSVSSMILLSEESRRMMEMRETYKGQEEMLKLFGDMPLQMTLVLNKNNPLVKSLISIKGQEERKEDVDLVCRQLYDLALMSHKTLTPEEMTGFLERSNLLLEKFINQ